MVGALVEAIARLSREYEALHQYRRLHIQDPQVTHAGSSMEMPP
jgi:hypothetical protein